MLLFGGSTWASTMLTFGHDQPVRGQILGSHLSILQDPDLTYDRASILAGTHDDAYERSRKDFPGFHIPNGQVWIRIVLTNRSESKRALLLESRYPLLDRMTSFIQRSGSLLNLNIHSHILVMDGAIV